MREKRKKPSAGVWLALAYALVVLGLGAVGLNRLHRFLTAYESSRPWHVTEAFVAALTEDEVFDELRAAAPLSASAYDDVDGLFAASLEPLRGKDFSWRESPSRSTPDAPVYVIRFGPAELYRLTLRRAGDAGFGFSLWEPAERELIYFDRYVPPETLSITIELPPWDTPFVDGRALDSGEAASLSEPFTDLRLPEGSFETPPVMARYEIDSLYHMPEVGDLFGPLAGTEEDGRTVFRYVDSPEAHEEHLAAARTFFDTYMLYASGSRDAYYPLLRLTLRDSELYTYISTSSDAMYWAEDVKAEYEKLEFTRFAPWGENAFTCTVSYSAELTGGEYGADHSENSYDLAFVRRGERWYCAAMSTAWE